MLSYNSRKGATFDKHVSVTQTRMCVIVDWMRLLFSLMRLTGFPAAEMLLHMW